jgi:cation:H+ antiporter
MVALAIFALGTLAIFLAGTRLTKVADQFADRTGMGEAVVGALFLGGVTSLPGLAASVTAAWNALPEMAVSNAVGGIAVQTLFLVVADFSFKQVNLEHAAASHTNLFQGSVLISLLAMPIVAANVPWFSDWPLHPVSILMVACYVLGLHGAGVVRRERMWRPRQTRHTREDRPDPNERSRPASSLVWSFAALGLTTAFAGWMVGSAGVTLVRELGWRESAVGGLLTAIASSLPELVTTLTAVRRGAYTLAVSGIVGGNAFDTLFVAVSDAFYPAGSIYHSMGDKQQFLLGVTIVMSAVLLGGLVRRERTGPANIGTEGVVITAAYLLVAAVMFF